MSGTQGRRALIRAALWRWRRSPLRRGSDLVEAWVLLAAWVLAVVGGALIGAVTAGAADRSYDRQRSERREVVATVVEKHQHPTGQGDASTRVADGDRPWATVRWTARDGEERTGRTQVTPGTDAGGRVTVWTDPQGALAAQPLKPAEALIEAALLGAMASVATGGVVWAGAHGVRGRLERRRLAQWEEEWRRLDSRWGRKTG
jgi:hypothetical protein